uniref:Uncharacterized protein n=1 Tax=viral metagenome TaxID=1070528 RepID=A0A6M3L2I1_9ZZZZ
MKKYKSLSFEKGEYRGVKIHLTLNDVKKAHNVLKSIPQLRTITINGKKYYVVGLQGRGFMEIYKYRGKYFDRETKQEVIICQ